jgi:hypothetical protein
MFINSIKKKVRGALAALLVVTFVMTGGTFSVFANTNGGGAGTPGAAATATNWGPHGSDCGIVVFLTDLHPYILDNTILRGERRMGFGDDYNDGWLTMRERGYNLNMALAQVFRRTYISWLEPKAVETLMFIGWNNWWQYDNLGIGYNFSHRSTNPKFKEHTIRFNGTLTANNFNAQRPFWEGLARHGSHGGWTANPNGQGLFKKTIDDYLLDYLVKGNRDENPRQFFNRLYTQATPAQRDEASYIWSFIAAGSGALTEPAMQGIGTYGNPEPASPAERWEMYFSGSGDLTWHNTFLYDEKGLHINATGGLEQLGEWGETSSPGSRQVAAYLDTLLTLALMARNDGKNDLGLHYLNAAIDVFGNASSWAQEPDHLQQKFAIVIQLTRAQNWAMSGAPTLTGPTDWWVHWRRERAGGMHATDFRQQPQYKNDFQLHPLLEDSPTFRAWAGAPRAGALQGNGVFENESVCRLALRLHAMQSSNASPRLSINSDRAEVTIWSNGQQLTYGGMINYAPTASRLGRITTGSELQISRGVTPTTGNWRPARDINIVGPQFVIGMFGHITEFIELNIPITHSISVSPDFGRVEPQWHDNFDTPTTVEYRVSSGFGPFNPDNPTQGLGGVARPCDQTATRVLEMYREYVLKHPDTQVQIRTSFARRAQVYQVFWRYSAGHPDHPRIVPPGVDDPAPFERDGWELLSDTDWEHIPFVHTRMGNQTINTREFEYGPTQNITNNQGWSNINGEAGLRELLTSDDPFFTYTDHNYREWAWPQVPEEAEEIIINGTRYFYYAGAWYVLMLNYRADTQLRIVNPANVTPPVITTNYSASLPRNDRRNTSVTRFLDNAATNAPVSAIPMSFGARKVTQTERSFDYAIAHAMFSFSSPFDVTIIPDNPEKPHIPYSVYSSSPEAFAELKNWGVASTSEPGDCTYFCASGPFSSCSGSALCRGLGDGRSPVDTAAGVSLLHHSNGSTLITEDYEVMAGVPTTEKLYLAVGGSEFIIDLAVQYVPNETAIRAYTSSFSGVRCQFNWNASGTASGQSDFPNTAFWTSHGAIPQVQANGFTASVAGSPSHNGFTVTLTMNGQIRNDSATRSNTQTGSTSGSGTGGSYTFSDSLSATGKRTQTVTLTTAASSSNTGIHNANTTANANATVTATTEADPNAADVTAFNAAMTAAETWSNDMVNWLNGISFAAASDGVVRAISDTTTAAFIVNRTDLPGEQAASGSLSISAPADFFRVMNDGAQTPAFNVVSYSGVSMNVTNPADVTATNSNSNSNSGSATAGCTYEPPSEGFSGTPCNAGDGCVAEATANTSTTATITAQPSPTAIWSMSVTFTIEPHIICGSCCNHNLPAINDFWQQSFNYDYLKIIGLSILRLDQGAAFDDSNDGSGLEALIGTRRLGATRQTFFSGPSFNIAQANIFNYMGLQTDGTRDVNTATNEYFRSLAVGLTPTGAATSHGQTRSSQAGRVRYWLLNAGSTVNNGIQVTSKGNIHTRHENHGNTVRTFLFANELAGYNREFGLFDSHDFISYSFGQRSNLCDGTARGGRWNIDKSSWVEQGPNGIRGKAAYDLEWARGFLYDGIGEALPNGSFNPARAHIIGNVGFSVSHSYQNNARGTNDRFSGIWQPDNSKGFNGIGVTSQTLIVENFIDAYELPFIVPYADTMLPLLFPIHRDFSRVEANFPVYSDTNPFSAGSSGTVGSTTVWPCAANGEVSPYRRLTDPGLPMNSVTEAVAEIYSRDNDTRNFLTTYTNTAYSQTNNENRVRQTQEYLLMQAKRSEMVMATVISDILVFNTTQGLMPVLYHYKNASRLVRADERAPDTRTHYRTELWTEATGNRAGFNPLQFTGGGNNVRHAMPIAGYTGRIGATVFGNDNQLKMHERNNPTSRGLFVSDAGMTAAEAQGGVPFGARLNARTFHGRNINAYLNPVGNQLLLAPRVLSNPNSTGVPVNRALLYNISPIRFNANNRLFDPGVAEVFWEAIVLWKDTSNHDYYSSYHDPDVLTNDNKRWTVYLGPDKFVRHPELLDNHGQRQRDPARHSRAFLDDEDTEDVFAGFFVDSCGVEAHNANIARAAQEDQWIRGFGVAGFNHDSTNSLNVSVNGVNVTHREMHNESFDLTHAARGSAYGSAINSAGTTVGIPFIMAGLFTYDTDGTATVNTAFNTANASRHIGVSGAAAIPKRGFIQQTSYLERDSLTGPYRLNPVIVQTPVTARAVQIMPLADWRDQRVLGQSSITHIREMFNNGCPGLISLCDFVIPNCKYERDMHILDLNFVGTGNSVPNAGVNAPTQGNIILAGNFTRTSTGLSSGGSAGSGISLRDIGGEYNSMMNYLVEATTIRYGADTGEQTLFGFGGYGITLCTTTQRLFIRVQGSPYFVEVAGTFLSGQNLMVEFNSLNAASSRVWVDGEPRMLSISNDGPAASLAIGSGQIGGMFFLGAWNGSLYTLRSDTRIETLSLTRLRGSNSCGVECATSTFVHSGGNNIHVHSVSCFGRSDSAAHLAGTLAAHADGTIGDLTLRERLGDSVYNALPTHTALITIVENGYYTLSADTVEIPFTITDGIARRVYVGFSDLSENSAPRAIIRNVAGNAVASVSGSDGTIGEINLVLDAGDYTLVIGTVNDTPSVFRVNAVLGHNSFTHAEVLSLPNDIWRTIPSEINGSPNPVLESCTILFNRHECTLECEIVWTYDRCMEPHHRGLCYNNDMCFSPCFNDNNHNPNLTQIPNVGLTQSAEFVSMDWDFTLYASTIDNFRGTHNYQLTSINTLQGRGYVEEMDTVRFTRSKYIRFPWAVLYGGVFYEPNTWILLGDRGTYAQGSTNNRWGIGGREQCSKQCTMFAAHSSACNPNTLYAGEQAAPYNVKNWSLYNQPIYKDLYMDFYDFYIPLYNDELNAGTVLYATIPVNAETEGAAALSNFNQFDENNKVRDPRGQTSNYGATRTYHVDLVGRIGGFVIQDTTDVRFSTTFKEEQDFAETTILTFSGLNSTHPMTSSHPSRITSAGMALNSLNDWAGFDFDADNERTFTITVNGN